MRSASRLVIVALSVLFLALPVSAPASAAPAAGSVAAQAAAQPPTAPPPSPGATAPAGPRLEPADTEAERAESRRKLIMGGVSVVLVAIVVWGRSIRRKKAKA